MINVCFSNIAYHNIRYSIATEQLHFQKVICIPDDLSMGDISDIHNFYVRKPTLIQIFHDDRFVDNICKTLYQEFFDTIDQFENITIWYTETSMELCGLLYVCWLLRNYHCNINIINCSRNIHEIENINAVYVSDITESNLYKFQQYQETLSIHKKSEYSMLWQRLMEENGALRIKFNNSIVTVDENTYDKLILNYIPSIGSIPILSAVNEIFLKNRDILNYEFIISRIKFLINSNYLFIDENGSFINSFIRKNKVQKK